MNRGSNPANAAKTPTYRSFNEAPIHESGKYNRGSSDELEVGGLQ